MEGIFLFALLPVLLTLEWIPLFWGLGIGLAYALIILRVEPVPHFRHAFLPMHNGGMWKEFRFVILRFLCCAAILLVAVHVVAPDRFLSFPLEEPAIYLRVMLLYPVTSVLPQELLFRVFFFRRYAEMFATPARFLVANAIAFSWAHLLFGNAIALGFTLVAGWFFATTYHRTRSFYLVCLEHTLYGSLIWTSGLGDFFYHANWSFSRG